ncbi:MAG: hypothetical protein Q4P71_08985 [Actinomycetaceae bacterium]|nr:hypothetical protein [Actinomycetaceae bacterium]
MTVGGWQKICRFNVEEHGYETDFFNSPRNFTAQLATHSGMGYADSVSECLSSNFLSKHLLIDGHAERFIVRQ